MDLIQLSSMQSNVDLDSPRAAKARELFLNGYNCAQAVLGAFSDLIPLSFEDAMMLTCGFGGGMGRLREVCGAVSGGMMVLGFVKGFSLPVPEGDDAAHKMKADAYDRTQGFAKEFASVFGSYLCRDLLELKVKNDAPNPSERTAAFYAERPCGLFVAAAAAMVEALIK